MKECNQTVMKEVMEKSRSSKTCNPKKDACDTVKYIADIQEFDTKEDENFGMSLVTIAYQDHDVENLTTFINYGVSELFCEIGGILGLTLGLSALSILGLADKIFNQLFTSLKARIKLKVSSSADYRYVTK